MAVVMGQTRKGLETVAPDASAATGGRVRPISRSRHFPPPGWPSSDPAATLPVVPGVLRDLGTTVARSLRLVGSRSCVGRADAVWLRTRDREPPE
jgi:hypothetical protein